MGDEDITDAELSEGCRPDGEPNAAAPGSPSSISDAAVVGDDHGGHHEVQGGTSVAGRCCGVYDEDSKKEFDALTKYKIQHGLRDTPKMRIAPPTFAGFKWKAGDSQCRSSFLAFWTTHVVEVPDECCNTRGDQDSLTDPAQSEGCSSTGKPVSELQFEELE
jgi:hypothetical protein